MIKEFKDKYYFLSNFYNAPVCYERLFYENNEAAFQSAKCLDEKDRVKFTHLLPNEAKRIGRKVQLRDDWEQIKDQVMYDILLDKFTRNKDLKAMLLDTGDQLLQEGNWWGDKYWGVCNGEGLNRLGELLMMVREDIREEL